HSRVPTAHVQVALRFVNGPVKTTGREGRRQGRTDNSWGPRAIGDHGAPVSSPTLKLHPKNPMKGTRGIS
ncbi:unnamed protein product, partial [Staurois parvus]